MLFSSPEVDLLVSPLNDDQAKRILTVKPKSASLFVARRQVVTSYPDKLILQIFERKKSSVCDEIARDEDPSYVGRSLADLLSFFPAEHFAGKRVLDFGCGSGASTMVLSRLLKQAAIYGVEFEANLLAIAKARAIHYGFPPQQLLLSPNADTLPAELPVFDVVILSAVWEHLLPPERFTVLKQIWSVLRSGGQLFINQTPHRFAPIESHTTGLPLINYLPDRAALILARKFSRRMKGDETWENLLRQGIRGGTQREVMRLIRQSFGGSATVLAPHGSDGITDLIDLWYRESSRSRLPALKSGVWALLKCVKMVSGAQIVPSLTLAIQKHS